MKTDRDQNRAVRGMTLLELLVAFAVFVLLIAALVTLANTGLDTWTSGESRKDSYDRAQAILDLLSDDLRNTFGENAFYNDGKKDLMSAAFLCDLDDNRAQRLRFVRGGDREVIQVDPILAIRKVTPTMYFGDFWEVAYVLDSDPAKNTLYRGIRYFDRKDDETFFSDKAVARTTSEFFRRNAIAIDDGVLYLGFKFWTPDSSSWQLAGVRYHTCKEGKHSSLVQLAAPADCFVCGKPTVERPATNDEGPSLLWDSTRRRDPGFRYHVRRQDRTNPDFVYPEVVQVTLVLESHASEVRGLRLAEPLEENATVLRVSGTDDLPDPPYFVKVGGEWIEYNARSYDEIKVKQRGARGTKAKPHAKGAAVRFGETFVTEVRIPAYRKKT